MASKQEALIKDLSHLLFGGQSLFSPQLYRKPPKEPADLVWVFERTAFIFHMTSGKKSFDQKRAHNTNQLKRWIKHWRDGHNLNGEALGSRLSYSYDDVDQIVGISIVGGNDTGCIYDADLVDLYRSRHGDRNKVLYCGTISDEVLERLAARSCTARDLLNFLTVLKSHDGRMDNETASYFVDCYVEEAASSARDCFGTQSEQIDGLNRSWRQARDHFHAIRNDAKGNEFARLFGDFTLSDIVWMSVAERALSDQLAPPGSYGPVSAGARRQSGVYEIFVVVAAGLKFFPYQAKDFLPKKLGLTQFSFCDFGIDNPSRIFAASPGWSERTMLFCELKALYENDS